MNEKIGIHRQQPSLGQRQDGPHAKKTAPGDAEAFKDAMKDGKQAGSPAQTKGEADDEIRAALQDARKNLFMSTGRIMQQTAKDIERENIDKGF